MTLNRQVRATHALDGTILILACWCPRCKKETGPTDQGTCQWCDKQVLDLDTLTLRNLTIQVGPIELDHPTPDYDAVADDDTMIDQQLVLLLEPAA